MLCSRRIFLRTFKPDPFSLQPLYSRQRFSATLCPRTPLAASRAPRGWSPGRPKSKTQSRNSSSIPESTDESPAPDPDPPIPESGTEPPGSIHNVLPLCCPGCGAFSQTVEPNEAGYYSKTRKQTRKRLAQAKRVSSEKNTEEGQEGQEDAVDLKTEGEDAARDIQQLIAAKEAKEIQEEGKEPPKPTKHVSLENAGAAAANYLEKSTRPVQVCDRCHDLMHHNKAVPATSPSIHAIRELLDESPHKENHVYHILDAADFPMSLIRGIYGALELQEQRSRNRRSTTEKYKRGRKMPDITFVITRADLLAPQPEMVDSKMEYMRSVLRDALGKSVDGLRLGNVRMISCFRGWRTAPLKEQIRKDGGGAWVVGKTNVGKSQFIENCFPKDSKNFQKIAELVQRRQESGNPSEQDAALDPDSLLPPAPREDLYPVLPVVSSLSGTTVSPIRIPFGRGKGEMIDLPGLHRDGLEDYVADEHKSNLTMSSYMRNPPRQTIGKDQSLLLGGGLVRVTPVDPNDVLIAACFVPLETHVNKTNKAIAMQTQAIPYPKRKIMKPGVGESISSAGIFDLKWDVTGDNLPRKLAKLVKDKHLRDLDLPYQVFGADLLIEGCGWVELSVQTRNAKEKPPGYAPQIEVFTPNGRHVGWRQPINCYSFVDRRIIRAKRNKPPRGRQNIGLKKRQAGGSQS